MIGACYATNPTHMEAADGSEDAIDKSSLSERWGITRVDAEGAEPAPDGARDRTVATPARSATAKPKVRPSPKVGAKAKAGKTAKAKAKAKASPKRKAADKVKKVAIAKHKAQRSKKVSPECKASPKAAPKHKMRKDKDEVERKLHSVHKLNPTFTKKTFVHSSGCQNKVQLPVLCQVQGIFRCAQRSQNFRP